MSTSGVTDFRPTVRDFITGALHDNAIVPLSEQPEASEFEACTRRLNMMLKSWSVRANLWREATATVTIPAGTGQVALSPDVQEVIAVRHAVTASYNRPLAMWTRDQFNILPNPMASGSPSAVYVERGVNGLTLKVWSVPATDIDVVVDYIRAVEIATDGTQTLDFREEFAEAVQTNLALRCCPIFEKQPHPELVARAQRLEAEMLDADRPASYFMESGCY